MVRSRLPEELTEEQGATWADEFMESMRAPGVEKESFFAERRGLGRGVGLDENGALVRAMKPGAMD
ncbi:hypothetical protein [Salinarimonas sp.]|uniref:hypothetical protein n=1 Tax=Salinarimonas sp. TaxID=2766526 RepID=UPI0032D9A530